MWSAEPIGAVSSARTPRAHGQHLDQSRDRTHDRDGDKEGEEEDDDERRSLSAPRQKPNATPSAPSRYAVHRVAVTTAEDKVIGRSPGAQP